MIKTIHKKNIKISLQILILIFAIIYLIYRPFYFTKIVGASMEPTFIEGQIVIANSLDKNYFIKDIIIAEQDSQLIIKRIAYVPGQKFICADLGYRKFCPIPPLKNTKRQIEYLNSQGIKCGIYKVPKDHYFLIGDNDNNSEDSRNFGPVHKNQIKAKIIEF